MLTRVKVIGAAAVLLCAGVSFATQADATVTTCPSGRACLWEDSGYNTNGAPGGYFAINNEVGHFGNYTYRGFPNDKVGDSASSVDNHGTVRMTFYVDALCSGTSFYKDPGGQDSNFNNGSPGPINFNDELSSASDSFQSALDKCALGQTS